MNAHLRKVDLGVEFLLGQLDGVSFTVNEVNSVWRIIELLARIESGTLLEVTGSEIEPEFMIFFDSNKFGIFSNPGTSQLNLFKADECAKNDDNRLIAILDSRWDISYFVPCENLVNFENAKEIGTQLMHGSRPSYTTFDQFGDKILAADRQLRNHLDDRGGYIYVPQSADLPPSTA